MSRGANLSIMGLYNNDNTIFNLMNYPNGFTATQQDTFIKNVLVECAEFEILYPNPTVMKSIIGIWSAKEKPYWDRVYAASQIDYDPIENYHRTETETTEDGRTEEHSGNDTFVKTGTETTERIGDNENVLDETNKETNSGSDSQDMSSDITETHSGNDTATTEVTGYDSNDLVIRDKVTTAHGHVITTNNDSESSQTFGHIVDMDHDSTLTETIDETDTITHNTTDTTTHGEVIEHTGETSRSLEAYGNIGTMTTQEMLTQELELAKIINVIPVMIESFKNRFCLMVY